MEYNIEIYKPTPKQRLFHQDKHKFVLYGGAKGGAKTTALVWECFFLSMEFPGNRGFLGRKRLTDLKYTTLKTFFREIPSEVYKIKERDHLIKFINGSEIIWGGLDNREEIVKFNSMELGFFAVDQAEEISYEDFVALVGTLRHKLPNGKKPRYKGLLTCNPRNCWLKEKFILNPEPDFHFIPALPKDNPHLPKEYLDSLKEVLKYRPKLYKAYIEGSWDELEDADLIIPYNEVVKCVNREVAVIGKKRIIISCDPAGMGEDETVIYVFENLKMIEQKIIESNNAMEIVGYLSLLHRKYNSDVIIIDATSFGAPIYDRLMELKLPAVPFISSQTASEPEKFKNVKAEAWFITAEKFHLGEISIFDDDVLKGQLSGVKFVPYGVKIEIEPKKATKDRLGRSPDRAEAVVMACYAYEKLTNLNSEVIEEEYRRVNQNNVFSRTGYG